MGGDLKMAMVRDLWENSHTHTHIHAHSQMIQLT